MEEENEKDTELPNEHLLQSDDKSTVDDGAKSSLVTDDEQEYYQRHHQQSRSRTRKPVNGINWTKHGAPIRTSQGQGKQPQDAPDELMSMKSDVSISPVTPIQSGDHSLQCHWRPSSNHWLHNDRHHRDHHHTPPASVHSSKQAPEEISAEAKAERREGKGIAARGGHTRPRSDIHRTEGPSAVARCKLQRSTAPAALQVMELEREQEMRLLTFIDDLNLKFENEFRQLTVKYDGYLNNFQLQLATEFREKLLAIKQAEVKKAKERFRCGSDDYDEGGEFDYDAEFEMHCPRCATCNCCLLRIGAMRADPDVNGANFREPAEHTLEIAD